MTSTIEPDASQGVSVLTPAAKAMQSFKSDWTPGSREWYWDRTAHLKKFGLDEYGKPVTQQPPTERDWVAKELHPNSGSNGLAIMQRNPNGLRRVDDGKGAFTESDARLISAAPELLAALEAIQARIAGEWDHPALVAFGPLRPNTMADCARIARAAILKATQA